MPYQATWLRLSEIEAAFRERGIEQDAMRQWLYRALRDRGMVTTRDADAAVDLFRLATAPLKDGYAENGWKPDFDLIDWSVFGIRAPISGRYVSRYEPVPIEVSRDLLSSLLTAPELPPKAPVESIADPAASNIVKRKSPGPPPVHRTAATSRMVQAVRDGRLTVSGLAGMKQEALAAMFEVSRGTADAARGIALSELSELSELSSEAPPENSGK